MKAGIGFVDPEIKNAASYYQCFRHVAITSSSSMMASMVYIKMGEAFTLLNLVRAMDSRMKPGDDLLIACHGNRHSISLRPGLGLWLDNTAVEMMLNPSTDQASIFKMTKNEYIEMITKIEKVQKLKLDHIALRACRIGNDQKFLKNFAKLFGAKSISAPTTRTMYAIPNYFGAETDQKAEGMFRSMYMNYFDIPLRYMPQKKTTLGTRKVKHSTFKAGFWIESREVFKQFISENLPDHATPSPKQEALEEPTPIHGFCVPGDSSKFYFPKDPRYSQALTFVYAGERPMTSNVRNAMAAA